VIVPNDPALFGHAQGVNIMDYNTMRQFADSWGLLYLFLIFVGVILFTFRPGSRKQAEKNANIVLKEDERNGRQ
jgi:cytochrome c oxidase cbb3-type subunit 4